MGAANSKQILEIAKTPVSYAPPLGPANPTNPQVRA